MSKHEKLPKDLMPISEYVVIQAAEILGPHSTSQSVIDEVERRRNEGGKPIILYSSKEATFFVMDFGPYP